LLGLCWVKSVVYDSAIERDFAESLEKNRAVKCYAKLPGWFKVPTPLGTYNPDDELRDREGGKIKCGAAHFAAW